jgi:excisionase family DNA binding protein
MALIAVETDSVQEIKEDVREIKNDVRDLKKNAVRGEQWLTIEETCSLLKISKRTFFDWKAKGILPFAQVGSKIYIKRSDIDKLLESRYSGD